MDYLAPQTPAEPKGVWCFFHSEELSPVELHGGSVKNDFRKIGRKLKQFGRIFVAKTRGMTDYPLAGINGETPAPYLTQGQETRGDITYKVVTVSFYYKDNPATGVGWQMQPTNPSLGYHRDDIEFVSIYYQDGVPTKVYFSEHSVGGGNGTWLPYNECEFRNGFLSVFIARNSHANYPHPGTHYRVYLAANDETESRGPSRPFMWSEMNTSYDWNNGHGITLYKGLRPPPPDFSKSSTQRILYGL